MVCCLMPCINSLHERAGLGPRRMVCCNMGTEIFRWLFCVIPIYLAVWRYAELVEYTIFIPGQPIQLQYWGVVTAIVIAVTIFIYIPSKVAILYLRLENRKDLTWRPTALFYPCFSALPSLTIITVAAHQVESLDSITIFVLHSIVLFLTVTEWLVKIREEYLTYDLISALGEDFFYSYEIIEFISLPTGDPDIYNSNWAYACSVFTFVAMFRYIPAKPTSVSWTDRHQGPVVNLVVTMVCCDIPFMIIRISTLIIFKLRIGDLIYPVKNVGLIIFTCSQLYMIYDGQLLLPTHSENQPVIQPTPSEHV